MGVPNTSVAPHVHIHSPGRGHIPSLSPVNNRCNKVQSFHVICHPSQSLSPQGPLCRVPPPSCFSPFIYLQVLGHVLWNSRGHQQDISPDSPASFQNTSPSFLTKAWPSPRTLAYSLRPHQGLISSAPLPQFPGLFLLRYGMGVFAAFC